MSSVIERDKDFVWHPFTQHQLVDAPLEIVKARGTLLYGADGRSYMDVNSSWWVNTHGHGHPHIGKAISEQFEAIDHVVFAGVTHPKAVELAERIVGHLPNAFQKVFFSDNGSTAVEVALKMVIQYWHNTREDRRRLLALDGAYHGDTFGAMSVGQRGYFNLPYEPYFFDVDFLDFPTRETEQQVLAQADELFQSGTFAGLIVEPLVQGACGMRMYRPEFLDQLIQLARQHNVLVIFDEVMTGFGRTGKMFAMDYCREKPDMVALSKGLTAGVLPLGLTVATDRIFNAFLSEETTKALLHGHSFTANAISCAVACASLDLFERKETWDQIGALIRWNSELLARLQSQGNVINARQQGTILAFEVVVEGENNYFSDIRTTAHRFMLEKGIYLRPLGNTLFINPPYCITKEEFDHLASSLLDFLDQLNERKS